MTRSALGHPRVSTLDSARDSQQPLAHHGAVLALLSVAELTVLSLAILFSLGSNDLNRLVKMTIGGE